jgi:hypothetical protein
MRSEKPLNLQFLVAKIQRKSEITKDLAKKELPPFRMTAHDRPVKVSAS